jgi:hypothetical protein
MLFSVAAFAQEARLTGAVTDASGAIIVGAVINAVQVDRNLTYKTLSDETGRYLFPRLPNGALRTAGGDAGLQDIHSIDLNMTTSGDRLNITIGGQLTEQVAVSAEASRVRRNTINNWWTAAASYRR